MKDKRIIAYIGLLLLSGITFGIAHSGKEKKQSIIKTEIVRELRKKEILKTDLPTLKSFQDKGFISKNAKVLGCNGEVLTADEALEEDPCD